MITISPEGIAERHGLATIETITSAHVRCHTCLGPAEFVITYRPCDCAEIDLTLCARCADNPDIWADARTDAQCRQPAACGYDR